MYVKRDDDFASLRVTQGPIHGQLSRRSGWRRCGGTGRVRRISLALGMGRVLHLLVKLLMILLRLSNGTLVQVHPRDAAASLQNLVCARNVAPDIFNVLICNAALSCA